MSLDPRTAAATALRAAAAACDLGGGLAADAPLAWVPRAVGHLLDGAAGLVTAGPGWTDAHRAIVAEHVADALDATPKVSRHDAREAALGLGAWVSIVRRWIG